jgi:cytochrome P450
MPNMGDETLGQQSTRDAFQMLSQGFGAGNVGDFYPMLAEFREATPIMEGDLMAQLGVPSKLQAGDPNRPTFTVFRYDDIAAILKDSSSFTSGIMLEAYGMVLGRMMTGLDGEEHMHMRQLLQPIFTQRMLETWRGDVMEPLLREEFVVPLADKGQADLLIDFAQLFPVRFIYRILGLPEDPELVRQFNEWALTLLLIVGVTTDGGPDQRNQATMAIDAATRLFDHVLEVVRARRAASSPGKDLISLLLAAEYESRSLDDMEIASFIRSLLPAAADTTTRSFSNLLYLLLTHPEALAAVRADRSLLPGAINEALRYEGTVTVAARQASRDVELRGVRIPKGAGLNLITASGNRDPAAYPDPDRFDIRRKGKPILTFNLGPHMCLGIHIAKMELLSAMNMVLDHFPDLRFDPDTARPQVVGGNFRCPDHLNVRWG